MFGPTDRQLAQETLLRVKGLSGNVNKDKVLIANMLEYIEELEWSVGRASA